MLLREPKIVVGVGSSFDELPNEDWCWLGGGGDVGFSLAERSDDGCCVVGFLSSGRLLDEACCVAVSYTHLTLPTNREV